MTLAAIVSCCLAGCGDDGEGKGVSLGLRVVRDPELHQVKVLADIRNDTATTIFGPAGCTACSDPLVQQPVEFTIVDGVGRSFSPIYPCDAPAYCSPVLIPIPAGESREQVLIVKGVLWTHDIQRCYAQPSDCTEYTMPAGHFEVRGLLTYGTDVGYSADFPSYFKTPPRLLAASAALDWE
jgi:hypothetical protein